MYNGSEKLTFNHKELPSSILDFWSWAYSDLIRNVNRGAFAEFIVKSAIDDTPTTNDNIRISMDAYDLLSPEGIRIEVKSSAYIQSWESTKPSRISFRIAPAKATDEYGNYSEKSEYKRHSDVYVFCVWTAQTRDQNILDLSLWDFYVLPTTVLNEKVPLQKTITFQSLLNLHPEKVDYFSLASAIRNAAKK